MDVLGVLMNESSHINKKHFSDKKEGVLDASPEISIYTKYNHKET